MGILALLCSAGCATVERPTAKEEIAVWLSEAPRSIAVEVDRQLPPALLRTRDHHVGQRVGKGLGYAAAGGLYSVAYGCVGGGPIGCILGVIIAPFAMVAGAVTGVVTVKTTEELRPAEGAGEGPPKMRVAQVVDLPALLQDAVVAERAARHSLHASEAVESEHGAKLRLRITDIELFGDPGDDPALAFTLRASAELRALDARAGDWGSYAYSGTSHDVSRWQADDARLFREELHAAVKSIAKQVAADLRASPSRSAVAKVAAARRVADPVR